MSEVPDQAIQQAAEIAESLPKRPRLFRRAINGSLDLLTFAYLISLVVLLGALEWWGERHWLLSVLLYGPPVLVLTPLVALTPLSLIFRARLVVWQVATAALVCFGYITFRWHPEPVPTGRSLTAVTLNVGQSNPDQVRSFLEAKKPDLLLLQDVKGPLKPHFTPTTPMNVSRCGEFILFSKFPVRRAQLLGHPTWEGDPVAARFEVEVRGETLVLYNVHLPTPRTQLRKFLHRRIGRQLLSDAERQKRFADYRQWLEQRVELARALAKVFSEERLPFLIAGDFNTPDHGYIYHLFAGEATDAFADAGRGWGLTFPGHTRPMANWLAPWLRLDYFFVGHGWRATECHAEEGRRSEHRAVFARFEPIAKP